MAWYPEAVRESLTKTSGLMPKPVRINLHTAVSNSTSLRNLFNIDGQPWSHFYVNRYGVVYQYRDTAYHARCDLDGNPDTISVETWDGYRRASDGRPIPLDLDGVTGWRSESDVPAWTAAQVVAIKKLVRWIIETHPTIPSRLARSNRPGSESHGLSWHRLGVPGYAALTEAQGGLMYSTSRGKVCPGDRRISQIPGILAGAANTTNQSEEDDDMAMTPTERAALIADIAEAARAKIFEQRMTGPGIDSDAKPTMHDYLVQLPARSAAAVHQQWLGSSGPTIGVAVQSTFTLVRELASRAGVDVNEAAIAQELAALIAPVVREAVAAGGAPDAVADAVIARIGAAFSTVPKGESA